MKAIHGGKTKNDKIDTYKLATFLKGGNFPIAYSYPAKWRATRDLLRRRMYISRRCGELVAHIINTNTQFNLPGFKKKLSRKYNHDGVSERFEDPQVRKSVEVDLEMIGAMNQLLNKLEYHIEKPPAATITKPCTCCAQYPVWARSWRWSSCMRSTTLIGLPGCRNFHPAPG
jgi:hypothetical protein